MKFNLQPASRREILNIAKGTALCTGIMLLVFVALALAGIYPLRYTVFTGAVGGAAVAVLNFALMCLMVQNVTGLEDQKEIKKRVQASYNRRLFLQGLWALVAYLAPCFQVVAAVVPLFFPKLVILYRRKQEKTSNPTSESPAEKAKK